MWMKKEKNITDVDKIIYVLLIIDRDPLTRIWNDEVHSQKFSLSGSAASFCSVDFLTSVFYEVA